MKLFVVEVGHLRYIFVIDDDLRSVSTNKWRIELTKKKLCTYLTCFFPSTDEWRSLSTSLLVCNRFINGIACFGEGFMKETRPCVVGF